MRRQRRACRALRLMCRTCSKGSRFIPGTHEQGTEIKAITYSAMQIHERGEAGSEIFVIVDI